MGAAKSHGFLHESPLYFRNIVRQENNAITTQIEQRAVMAMTVRIS